MTEAVKAMRSTIDGFPARNVVVVGDLILDEYRFGKPARISREAPVLILRFAERQVFLGVNLKCASCHDSFIDDWKLADSWGLAAVAAEEPLEIYRCDVPTGRTAEP